MVKILSMEFEEDTDYLVSMIAHIIVKSMFQKSLTEKIKRLYTRAKDKAIINDKNSKLSKIFKLLCIQSETDVKLEIILNKHTKGSRKYYHKLIATLILLSELQRYCLL